ncbi:hypothetical protein [Pseudorhodoferax sp.]|uniref:hypothetical protein n=1 Tax=Pseudorhodoferax sp. TaxID=1993553 RepID=UPI002DD64775|nr:hypothetical protein [Pseudorhodoferax sp.]
MPPPYERRRITAPDVAPGAGPEPMPAVDRPAFLARAKAIAVNQDITRGEMEDRRHMVHWDEQIKPVLESVWLSLQSVPPEDLLDTLQKPLVPYKLQKLPKTVDKLWQRVASELNSAPTNLVAGRADINKAIEIVRKRVRKVTQRLTDDTALVEKVGKAGSGALANQAVMELYKDMAISELLASEGGHAEPTPIKAQITAIGFEIVGLLEGCQAPCSFIQMLHHAADSVTFDLSEKARREQTSAALAWLARMQSNHRLPAAERYEAMLTLLA